MIDLTDGVKTDAQLTRARTLSLVTYLAESSTAGFYSPTASEWVSLALLGLGPMGSAFYLWDKALKEGDPRIIGSISYLTLLLATL